LSERAHHIKKPAIVRQKTKIWSWATDGSPTPRQTSRLTVGLKLTLTSTSKGMNYYEGIEDCRLEIIGRDY
jgi:hypothetical protein